MPNPAMPTVQNGDEGDAVAQAQRAYDETSAARALMAPRQPLRDREAFIAEQDREEQEHHGEADVDDVPVPVDAAEGDAQ